MITDLNPDNTPHTIRIYTDGASRGNPGPAAGAFLAVDLNGRPIHEWSSYLGKTTNNTAEYQAVIHALEWAIETNIQNIEIISDSELVIKQINGSYRINKPHLKELADQVHATMGQVKSVNFKNAKREDPFISRCDKLCNKTLDTKEKKR